MTKKFSLAAVTSKAEKRAARWAGRGQQIAVEKHETAPRGGKYLNRYGLRRSAPGEPPAGEEGQLLATLQRGFAKDAAQAWSFIVNYSVLEYGYQKNGRVLEPRPLGVQTLNDLKKRADTGQGP